MSTAGHRARSASELLEELRALSSDFDRLSQAVADRLGLSPTDLLAMEHIARKGRRVTAGDLARELNLTTGAITGLVDRLADAGYARRTADPGDRRRVLVAPTARERRIEELFAPLAAELRKAVDGYSERDLAMLTDFIRRLRAAVDGTTEGVRRAR
jgi:DNA-binding MarR family transcriptional regulator